MTDVLAVWLGGLCAGTLTRTRPGGLRFTYDDAYRQRSNRPPLSLSMPKHALEYDGAAVNHWFDNLLPDDDEVRRRWATDFEAASPSPFNLLASMGIDCAGAVQVVPTGVVPDQTGALEPVSPAEIETRLESLRRDATLWNIDDHGGRWSLGGAQGKFALAQRTDGTWAAPTGRAASTHVFKVGVARFSHADVAEFVTMRAAKHVGLTVAPVEIMRFGDQTALVVQRYDRVARDDGIHRFHQEDMCQALGISRHAKYQSDDGPGVSDISDLIASLHPRSVRASRELFARALIYNWMTASPDAHAKNYSLLLAGDQARLAPLYDLTSGALLLDPDKVFFKGKSAMKIGGEYRFRNIDRSSLARCAENLRVETDWLMGVAEQYRDQIPDAFEKATLEAVADGGELIAPGTKDRYVQGIRSTVARAAAQAQIATMKAESPAATRTKKPGRVRGKATSSSNSQSFKTPERGEAVNVHLDVEPNDPFDL
ncbi:MAG: type II toxin-antitoxin system HipA family toxin [Nocardioidaceae bacterium]|nr:type II toxin-antitoxin system HipA family toxin [Nocardioidaceae bacterium]